MQDACQSEAAAVLIALPNNTILTCYFHLIKNIRDRLKGNRNLKVVAVPSKYHEMVLSGVSRMHWSRSVTEFNLKQDAS